MQVSNVLKALERKALIARSVAATNATDKSVVVTPAGTQALRAAFPIAIEVQHLLFGEAGGPGGSLLEALVEIETRGVASSATSNA